MMQSKYKPDDWLGLMMGARVYIDFTKYEFQEAYKMLLNELVPHIQTETKVLAKSEGKSGKDSEAKSESKSEVKSEGKVSI